jgi:hypothetical protein
MVVHGKSPQQVAALARKAWLALAASPVVLVTIFVAGDALYNASGHTEGDLLPLSQRLLLTVVLVPVALAAPVLAARWGHAAFSAGNRHARVPGIAGVVIALFAGVSLLGALLQK